MKISTYKSENTNNGNGKKYRVFIFTIMRFEFTCSFGWLIGDGNNGAYQLKSN